jgi:hypothetical protein
MSKRTILIIWAATALAFHVAALTMAYLGLLR